MTNLKAVIVEDEQVSRDTLAGYLEKYCEGVTLAATADSVDTGIEAIRKHRPDIVFLDVEMPRGNAFDLLERIDPINFETVFVTAFSNYAVRALNFSAAYYILKPVDIDELVSAVEKIRKQKESNNLSKHTRLLVENLKNANHNFQKIILPMMDGFEVVPVKDIIRCQANDNFTDFHIVNMPKVMICRTLKFYEELLSEAGFIRVHKSHLVNPEYVKKYNKGKGGFITMSDGSVVELSPNKKEEFLKKFGV